MTALGQDDIKALEQTRQRLLTLHTSISSLQQNVFQEQPLPSWSSLQSHFSLISDNVQELTQKLNEHQNLLQRLAVYPLPEFPGRTQDHILKEMLRTKLEPQAEEWVRRGQDLAQRASLPNSGRLSESDRHELWQWAPIAANDELRKQKWGADYTLAEKRIGVEKVVTGLQRKLVEPPSDSEGGGDDEEDNEEHDEAEDSEEEGSANEMDVDVRQTAGVSAGEHDTSASLASGPEMPLENILRFMMTGGIEATLTLDFDAETLYANDHGILAAREGGGLFVLNESYEYQWNIRSCFILSGVEDIHEWFINKELQGQDIEPPCESHLQSAGSIQGRSCRVAWAYTTII